MSRRIPEYSSGQLDELQRAQGLFELLEESSFQIGSGRPVGARSHLWGSVVLVARASLEAGLRRLHDDHCRLDDCSFAKPKFSWSGFTKQCQEHGFNPADHLPRDLHVSLQLKDRARGGHGMGVPIDGPTVRQDIEDLLTALNHIRNGFGHEDPRKTLKLPPSCEGVLWVADQTGTRWTVQKPHAYAALRACESIWRYTVLSAFGKEAALQARSVPVRFFHERLDETADLNAEVEKLSEATRQGDLKSALTLVRTIERRIATIHTRGHRNGDQMRLPGIIDELADPMIRTESRDRS